MSSLLLLRRRFSMCSMFLRSSPSAPSLRLAFALSCRKPMISKIHVLSLPNLSSHARTSAKFYPLKSRALIPFCFFHSLSHLHQHLDSIQSKNIGHGFGGDTLFGSVIRCRSMCIRSTKERDINTNDATKQISLNVPVIVEESLPVGPELQAMTDQLQLDGQLLLDLTMRNYKLAESADCVELSVLLCDDKYIQKLNKRWLGKNSPTDVLSFPTNEIPALSSLLLLGDIVISLETAKEQAEERGHNLLDEIRILLVHGFLHILGYDHERGPEAAKEMEEKEQHLLRELGWTGKGLIKASFDIDEKS